MKIAIVGAGLVGVSAALNFALRGHHVEVFERRSGIATEASFSGSGIMLSIALPAMQAQGLCSKGLRGLTQQWAAQRLRKLPEWTHRQKVLHEIGQISDRILEEWTPQFHLEFEQGRGLSLLKGEQIQSRKSPFPFTEDLQLLESLGTEFERLEGEALLRAEPALSLTPNRKGATPQGLQLPQIQVINARQLAQQLRHAAQELGAKFRLQQEVQDLDAGQGVRVRWRTPPTLPSAVNMDPPARPSVHIPSEGTEAFDAVVLCTGINALTEMGALPRQVPLNTQATCTLTAPLILPEAAPDPGPRGAVVDCDNGVIITRLGHQRIRLTDPWARAEPNGRPTAKTQARLYSSLERWFPGAARTSQAQAWQGWRPCFRDSAPVLGRSSLPNVWLSIGHGDQGNALAIGSGAILADLIEQKTPDLDLDALSLQRFR